ncbi:Aspartyl aminopeptidase [Desulfobulbus propionicus DSM 2032]|uniref:M18 family aminopeptidase n=1 Tax=Desulfobulbus propionicus (strain ATCC 33891 / DSM 2032 / VKM B-1956 / 1pr3) TaxID=577650 RepID=A0A7U3YN43_DESPD|nr:M18 family aminopeptidase [Desulfobulbus propionicus]ADW18438.1 Aspartyl aminopeptidase [Desulfobulbus propionicus DSM 2032]
MMHANEYIESLFSFINNSPTPFHAAANGAALLSANGFQRLRETDRWSNLSSGAYYVLRNDASLIAFSLNDRLQQGLPLRMAGAHTDSPGLKVKPNPLQQRQGCVQMGVEVYGGALLAPWFDRDLSLAGRVSWRCRDGHLHCGLIDCKRPVAIIPSLAIHLDREVNSKRSIDKQTDLIPLLMLSNEKASPDFKKLLIDQLVADNPNASEAEVLDFDLFLYDTQPLAQTGWHNEFITGARLDNLLSCHALLHALIRSDNRHNSLIVLNDHEEVGSVSTAGAQGPFLKDILERLIPDPVVRRQTLAGSLFISVDNAHAVHPNFIGKHDPEHLPLLNHGPVVKTNANQRYATNGLTASLFRLFCQRAEIPCQQFVMRNDLACGSTIGPLTAAELGVPTVDIGIPQLAMHSIRETAGRLDGWYLLRVMTAIFAAGDDALRCPEVGLP